MSKEKKPPEEKTFPLDLSQHSVHSGTYVLLSEMCSLSKVNRFYSPQPTREVRWVQAAKTQQDRRRESSHLLDSTSRYPPTSSTQIIFPQTARITDYQVYLLAHLPSISAALFISQGGLVQCVLVATLLPRRSVISVHQRL